MGVYAQNKGAIVHQQQIEELTHGVNNMLTLYLEVHNGMFAHPWWRSIPIPGLFKSIPFDRFEIQISKVEEVLRKIEGHVRALHKEATTSEKTYLAALHQYTVALLKTMIALRPIVVGLKGKTDGKPYDIAKYNTDIAAYQSTEKGYHSLGEEMNRRWRSYQSEARGPAKCEVHISDVMRGRRLENWVIGEQVKQETYDKFKDGSGRLYAMVLYEKGEPQMSIVAKAMWDQIEQQFGDIDAEAAAWLEKTRRDLDMK